MASLGISGAAIITPAHNPEILPIPLNSGDGYVVCLLGTSFLIGRGSTNATKRRNLSRSGSHGQAQTG
jgi:hypothetical protein